VPELELQRCTLEYTNISTWRLDCVSQAERERYIEDELDGIEPKPPIYTVICGGGILPSGKKLDTWTETHEYTAEHIDELRQEQARLKPRVSIAAVQARLVDIHNAIAAWDEYYETVVNIGIAVQEKRYTVGLWRMFGGNMPEDDGWIKEQEADGINVGEIPTDERKRFIYWLKTEAVATQEEFDLLIDIVENRSEEVRKARQLARVMFRRSLAEKGRKEVRGT